MEPAPHAEFGYGGAFGTFSLVRFIALCNRASKRTDAEIRVIMWYCGATLLDPGKVNRTLADIGAELGFSPDALSRMIKKLVKDRLLRKSGSVGRSPFYAITPYLVYRGSGYDHREAIKGWNPPHILGLTQEPESYLLVRPAEDESLEENFLTHIHRAAREARTAQSA
ncbi:MarR family transcriptional regulator [Kitasatospora sp. NPDC049285]|uniref:MarR family transcriptional regulator n=1 Tax=Kitasatospora sp. NPDC049285 TaxID=3157096 RepID=UPI0034198683